MISLRITACVPFTIPSSFKLTSPPVQLLPSELGLQQDEFMDWVSYPVFQRFVTERRRTQTPQAEDQPVPEFPSVPEGEEPTTLIRYNYLKSPGFLRMGVGSNSIKIKNAMEPLTEIPRAFDGLPNTGFLIPVPDPLMTYRDVWDYVVDQLGDDFKVATTGSDDELKRVDTLYVDEEVQFRAYASCCSGHKACNRYRHPSVKRLPGDTQHEQLAADLMEHREDEASIPMKRTLS
jgi:hypothetical protein